MKNVLVLGKDKTVYGLFFIGTLLLMWKSQRLLFIRPLSELLIYIFGLLVSITLLISLRKIFFRVTKFHSICLLFIFTLSFYDTLLVGRPTVISILLTLINITVLSIIVACPLEIKQRFLRIYITSMYWIVGISLFGWLLFVLNFPLPHYIDDSDPYYTHTIYYLFNFNGTPNPNIIPRFAGMFLEPGHLATISSFILYIEKFNLKKFGNILLFLAIILSFSLAGYGLLFGVICIYLFNKGKGIFIVIFISCFIGIGLVAAVYNNGDNMLNQKIFLRLAIDDNGEIAGNNRTTMAFDSTFDRFLSSGDILTGVGNRAFGEKDNGSDNITIGCAGYKRYFYLRGVLGSALLLFFLTVYVLKYKSKWTIGFYIVYLVGNFIRDYPMITLWIGLYLLAIPVLYKKNPPTDLCPRTN